VLLDKARNPFLVASWSIPSIAIILTVGAIALFGPWLGQVEGIVAPVTGKVRILNPQEDGAGNTQFRMQFEKLRSCELIGVTVRRRGVAVPAGPVANQPASAGTLTVGPRASQLWLVPGSMPLDDLSISWAHRCSVFWVTITDVYP
jgi:hypothetical protein